MSVSVSFPDKRKQFELLKPCLYLSRRERDQTSVVSLHSSFAEALLCCWPSVEGSCSEILPKWMNAIIGLKLADQTIPLYNSVIIPAHLLASPWAGACHSIGVCSAVPQPLVLPASKSRAPDEQNEKKRKKRNLLATLWCNISCSFTIFWDFCANKHVLFFSVVKIPNSLPFQMN